MRHPLIIVLFLLFITACGDETRRLSGYDVHGIDVSHYQSRINWDLVAAQDIHFTFVKATEGETLADSLFAHNWGELERVGITRGAYHFFRPTIDARAQFWNFMNSVELQGGDLPPVLDVEVTDGATRAELIVGIKTWLELTELHYNVKPIIYTSLKFYYQYIAEDFHDYPIWIARYNWRKPRLIVGKDWDFWQYGNRGRLEGIAGDVDFNVYNGTLQELYQLTMPEITLSVMPPLFDAQ